MKKHYLLPVILYIYSCSLPREYHQRLNYIPVQGPEFGVEILSENQVPKEAFFEVIEFYIVEKGRLTREEVLKKLELEAIKEGVDAVKDVECWNSIDQKVNFLTICIDMFDEDEETTYIDAPLTHITAVGIKYLENIDYLDKQPEFEYVYILGDSNGLPTPLFKIEFKPTGQEHKVYPESEEGRLIYEKYFKYYSDFHLLHQRERWYYKLTNDRRLKKRILLNQNGYREKTVFVKYDDQDKINGLTVNSSNEGESFIRYHYDEKGRMFSKVVITADQHRIYEEYDYQGETRIGRKISIINPGKKSYRLSTSILYYDRDYLKDYYYQEYAKNGISKD